MKVSTVIVTRGDVGLRSILESIPDEWEIVVWDNGLGVCWRVGPGHGGRAYQAKAKNWPAKDMAVYGRYAAIEHATGEIVFTQDDDCVVSDPQAFVDAELCRPATADWVVSNMPPEFRHDFYREHCLVGFGAAFHRDAPARAFAEYAPTVTGDWGVAGSPEFNRCCDVVFTALAGNRVLLDVPKEDLAWATDDSRMYRQETHQGERSRMLGLALAAREP